MNRTYALGACLVVFLWATEVRAEPSDPSPSLAVSLFREGRAFLAQGRFELACQRFAESRAAEPSIGALLNLADCDERAGKLIAAQKECLAARDLASSKRDLERASFAATRARELDDRIPRIQIEAASMTNGDLQLSIDGQSVSARGMREPIPVDPGQHVVEAEGPGRPPFRATVTATTRVVTVRIPPAPGATTEASPIASTSDVERKRPVGGLVAIGIGGALLVTGGILAGVALSRWNDVTAACPSRKCPDVATRNRVTASKDEASSLARLSTIGVIAGGALVVGGLCMYLLMGEKKDAITPLLDRNTAGAIFQRRF